jgi:hypothetical protein
VADAGGFDPAGLWACQRCSAPLKIDTGVCSLCLCADLGVTYRQLDYWTRQGYLHPENGGAAAAGSGTYRRWPEAELTVARLMGRLTAASIPPDVAAKVARRWPAGYELAPGIWIKVGNPFREPVTGETDAGGD